MLNIAVLVSGGGTNLGALIAAQKAGMLDGGRIVHVVSSNPRAYALTRADQAGIRRTVVDRADYTSAAAFDAAILETLRKADADLVVLAGFMHILGRAVLAAYPDRIVNVHPSLIPAFCGRGFYGIKVHEAALAYGVKVTGATVHLVNEVPDGGRILLQKAVEVEDNDTPMTLQQRVMEQAEWVILPKAVALLCRTLEPLPHSMPFEPLEPEQAMEEGRHYESV
ncbi:MAG: phosphoribosylglycinamide formyltransferase [Oscillospiraceae bacterium]|nr:phosphoribosylglycinamide formyltransferase [Oscillospiraceae bacterium]